MTAIIGTKQLGVQNITTSTTVPQNPTAKLMYYIYCIAIVLPINQKGELNKFINYQQYYNLSRQEKKQLLALSVLLRPDILMGKCIFLAPQLCGNFSNSFYKINQISKVLAISNEILIGGQQKKVVSIMTFTLNWLQRNYLAPLKSLSSSLQAQQRPKVTYVQYQSYRAPYQSKSSNCCCQVM